MKVIDFIKTIRDLEYKLTFEFRGWNNLIHKARGINRSGFNIPVAQYNDDIKTISTHEAYEANCYKV